MRMIDAIKPSFRNSTGASSTVVQEITTLEMAPESVWRAPLSHPGRPAPGAGLSPPVDRPPAPGSCVPVDQPPAPRSCIPVDRPPAPGFRLRWTGCRRRALASRRPGAGAGLSGSGERRAAPRMGTGRYIQRRALVIDDTRYDHEAANSNYPGNRSSPPPLETDWRRKRSL